MYELPNQDTLIKYLALLREVIVEARLLSYSSSPRTAELLDIVENIPDLLARFKDLDETIITEELRLYEQQYLSGDDKFSRILRDGPGPDWQLKTSGR